MTRAVLLDFYGTVAHASAWGPTREEVLARHGYAVPNEARRRWLADNLDGLDHTEHSRSRDHYRAWERQRLRQLVDDCGVGPDEAAALVEELDESSQRFTMVAYPETREVIAELRRRGVIVALCSNWTWDLDRAVDQAGLTGAFDVVVASARAGARKPHPMIYEHTLARCDVGPADALFVGDTMGPDVEGPVAYGMRAVHVWRPERGDRDASRLNADAPPPLPSGAYRVEDLRGVLPLARTAPVSRAES